jgi:hypothetical protein
MSNPLTRCTRHAFNGRVMAGMAVTFQLPQTTWILIEPGKDAPALVPKHPTVINLPPEAQLSCLDLKVFERLLSVRNGDVNYPSAQNLKSFWHGISL